MIPSIHNTSHPGVQLSPKEIFIEPDWLVGQDPPDESNRHPYVQVRETLRHQIESGRYKFGEKLPSVRDLSRAFQLSHPTILRAVEQLISQGYIEAISGRGTFVRYTKTQFIGTTAASTTKIDSDVLTNSLSQFGKNVLNAMEIDSDKGEGGHNEFGAPSSEHLPLNSWQQCLSKQLRGSTATRFPYAVDWKGNLDLRTAIANYLRRARGIFCEPDQIVITSGTQQSLALIARAVLEQGDVVAIEDPSAPVIADCLTMHGATVARIPVGRTGISIAILQAAEPKLCIVSPRNNPTGATLSPEKIYDLMNWAHDAEAFIIEDSFDNDFHYLGNAPEALLTQRRSERVITMGSFSKILHPLVTTTYLVVPKWMTTVFETARQLIGCGHNYLEQLALADFIESGQLELHVRRTRKAYATKRALLISALTQLCKQGILISQSSSGLHQVIRVSNENIDEKSVLQSGRDLGLPVCSTACFYADAKPEAEYMISFAALKDKEIFPTINEFWERINT